MSFVICKGFLLFLIAVSMTDLIIANVSAPSNDLKKPLTFSLILKFRIALSEPLLSGGTSLYRRKLKTKSEYLTILLRNGISSSKAVLIGSLSKSMNDLKTSSTLGFVILLFFSYSYGFSVPPRFLSGIWSPLLNPIIKIIDKV